MRIPFRKVKDAAMTPLHAFLQATHAAPALQRAMFGGMGLVAKAWYYTPSNHMRSTVRNLCRLAERDDARQVYMRLVDNVVCAAGAFGQLMREGAVSVAQRVEFDPATRARCDRIRAEQGCGIFVVPHCAGSVLSAAGFAKAYPTVVLVRESKSERRSAIMSRYFEKLEAELLFVRRSDPMAVARAILKALHEKKFIIGTTDLLRKTEDTVEVEVFGQKAWMPAWPARFSARRNVPILPGYIHMENGRLHLVSGESYIEKDLTAATQRWANYFQDCFRRWPSDWLFMFDKRWSRLLEEAARG